MLIVGPEDVKARLGQGPASASESHDIDTLGRCEFYGDQADDLVELEGRMHGWSCYRVIKPWVH